MSKTLQYDGYRNVWISDEGEVGIYDGSHDVLLAPDFALALLQFLEENQEIIVQGTRDSLELPE